MLKNIENNNITNYFTYKVELVNSNGNAVIDYSYPAFTTENVLMLLSALNTNSLKTDIKNCCVDSMTFVGKRIFSELFDEKMNEVCSEYSNGSIWSRPWLTCEFDEYFPNIIKERLEIGFYDEIQAIEKAVSILVEKAMIAWKMSGKSETFFNNMRDI